MPRRPRISVAVRRQITERDGERCAYCRSPMIVGIPMVIEHIVPLTGGGSSEIENLCLSCYRCNEFKGPRTEITDSQSGQTTALFHPRQQQWRDHFTWDEEGDVVSDLTASGRVTIEMLHLNNDWIVQARRIWMVVGLHPPLSD